MRIRGAGPAANLLTRSRSPRSTGQGGKTGHPRVPAGGGEHEQPPPYPHSLAEDLVPARFFLLTERLPK